MLYKVEQIQKYFYFSKYTIYMKKETNHTVIFIAFTLRDLLLILFSHKQLNLQ